MDLIKGDKQTEVTPRIASHVTTQKMLRAFCHWKSNNPGFQLQQLMLHALQTHAHTHTTHLLFI
jgi:hypothetical protein